MIGKAVAQYKIVEKIGAGGMGVVYRAEDSRLGRQVALKFLPENTSKDGQALERFRREARAASSLSHPGICTIHDIGEHEGRPFIVMEMLEGMSLNDYMSQKRLEIDVILDLSLQIAGALEAAHAKGIVHRDIKPDNLFIAGGHQAKILDFGLVKLTNPEREIGSPTDPTQIMDPTLTLPGTTMGTAAYMSPEQALGRSVDTRTDVFSFGAVLYEMIAGERPFHGESAQEMLDQVINKSPRGINELRKNVPPGLLSIVTRALAKNPADRFSSIAEMREALAACLAPAPSRFSKQHRKLTVTIGVALIAALGWIGSQFLSRGSDESKARGELFVEARRLIGDGKDTQAFFLLDASKGVVADDPALLELQQQCSEEVSFDSNPQGASVYFKDYLDTEDNWVLLGNTPIKRAWLPVSNLRFRIEKDGYETRELATRGLGALHVDLFSQKDAVEGMTYIPGGQVQLGAGEPIALPSYWMDTYEVSSHEYQKFIDAGGYQDAKYWIHPFVLEGKTISRDQAMARFKDATGRTGPAHWELGHYPEGMGDHPVAGVSWYEAAAYLEFMGKELPTLYHWRHAAGLGIDGEILLLSNFQSDGTAPVGSYQGLSPFGNYDMAGNVQEWCWNEIRGHHYSQGGDWKGPSYEFMVKEDQAHTPFTRLPTLGIRGMKTIESFPAMALDGIEEPILDFAKLQPVGDDLFAAYQEFYTYDHSDLDARIESVSEAEYWQKEKVSFKAAYGEERVTAYVFLPRDVSHPYQAVIYFPSGAARTVSSSKHLVDIPYWDFIIRSGRAIVYPVYENTYERQQTAPTSGPNRTREIITQWSKDIQRTIDYLETRSDIDSDNIAYYSLSLGSTYGGVFTAIEPRFRCSILLAGGFYAMPPTYPPDTLPINFLPRSKVPTLMVNGRYDFGLPVETAVKPMLEWLGAPEEDKKLYLHDGDHIPHANEIVRVTLDWLDRYMGSPTN